ncbi:hypothetical protein [Alienimonas chondri]|uniref:Uncharacterized protein n=1 Tax=Alienimonas chondri TaxID=2681879 RepID=A0ABX1VH64_9PLAN|nr:hypothetical protein [Alienimonas chondri]NNJ27416.1 hypothetical protein [Alienimonas chondri]
MFRRLPAALTLLSLTALPLSLAGCGGPPEGPAPQIENSPESAPVEVTPMAPNDA